MPTKTNPRTPAVESGSARSLTPRTAEFGLVSFEGPDPYASVGALGLRVTAMANALADLGFTVHHYFLGDPSRPGEETRDDARLTLHRWGQWISAHHPGGVYDGEEAKSADLADSLPLALAQRIAIPALSAGHVPLLLFEEWQTAEAACRLSEHLERLSIRDWCVIFWNANHPFGFDRIDWPRLARAATITTVSDDVRAQLAARGIDALVIPNGIPERLLGHTTRGRAPIVPGAGEPCDVLFKMSRWHRERGWAQAIGAIADLRERGHPTALVARTGGEAGSSRALSIFAARHGLTVTELSQPGDAVRHIGEAVRAGADVVNLCFPVGESLSRAMFASANAVLTNTIAEPFGRVGLEALAAGGIVFTGGAGSTYAVSTRNAVMLTTHDPREVAERVIELAAKPALASQLRRGARDTARHYTWPRLAQALLGHLTARWIAQDAEGGPDPSLATRSAVREPPVEPPMPAGRTSPAPPHPAARRTAPNEVRAAPRPISPPRAGR